MMKKTKLCSTFKRGMTQWKIQMDGRVVNCLTVFISDVRLGQQQVWMIVIGCGYRYTACWTSVTCPADWYESPVYLLFLSVYL